MRDLLETPAANLVERIVVANALHELDGDEVVPGWNEFVSRFEKHLDQFGYIIFQLNFAEPLPLDRLVPMLQNPKMYLRGEGSNPYTRQRASEEKRTQTTEMMLACLKGFKHWVFTKALNWGQGMVEIREDALAEIGLGCPMLRKIFLELGARFVREGFIDQLNDIFFLEKDEVDVLVNGASLKLTEKVSERKAHSARLKQETPPPMMPVKKRIMDSVTRSR